MAPRLRVLETNLLHADGALVWLDATTGDPDDTETMSSIRDPLAVTLTSHPRDLRWLAKPGRLVLWRRPSGPMIRGEADHAELARPTLTPYRIAGTAADPTGRFNPLRFDLTVTGSAGQPLLLYRSPFGAHTASGPDTGAGGVLEGTLRYEATGDPALDGQPARWALLRLDVTLVPADADNPAQVRSFVAQADANGDFRLLLRRLPPLSDGVDHYGASLSIQAPVGAAADAPPVAGLDAMHIGAVAAPFGFAPALALDISPGGVKRIDSTGRDHLAVTPAA
ncbi:MAG: carboxypeptidase regulatory-like domain-containing protein [Thiohalocapsa sp.]|uniref:carboxypeptidase regulatory-like domain-containing protein n=1 Tax=Thiohalocapsa sp. TaxID=2497641 RepID=UPI0025E277CE|nr:carboxypeptidase regulatory-like domain-containing protein [Thiohalocapsa sp.]MCG6942859.1 carboxypeptidase regulatory-like domain-containing protein [Thiohalocapsa sp.]